jgi:hypothetical protein
MPDYQVAHGHFWDDTWQSGNAFPAHMHRLILSLAHTPNYLFVHVKMDGMKRRDTAAGNFALDTAGLCGCTCVCLVRRRAGNVVRIAMYHRTFTGRWTDLVNLFNAAGTGAHVAGDTVELITVTEGNSFADVSNDLAGAGLIIPVANQYRYCRKESENLSFSIAVDGRAGELTGAELATAQNGSNGFGDI